MLYAKDMTPSPLRVLALFLGEVSLIQVGAKASRSGIHKRPVPEAWLDATGLRGDQVVNKRYHGGPDQAAYLYPQPDALAWETHGLPADLGRSYWGENVRLDGLSSADIRPGDRLHLGKVVLEATAPRLPCAVAAAYLSDVYGGPFVKDFYALGRPGIYVRVLQPGLLRVGDVGELEPGDPQAPTLAELMALHKRRKPDPETLHRALRSPLSYRLREEVAEKLTKVESAVS
ncbi:MOSC domain-containing protein [Deinococcus radiophilus]|uniref:MOSC domain-containing protein n=2 Tax=Deinococcus radiophilus TaxID=32062 RepID=A0A431W0I6_9DEIO|nr:MOSC domain-containing protein [Deinococcus radiophilus]